jgi:hypothetical protein
LDYYVLWLSLKRKDRNKRFHLNRSPRSGSNNNFRRSNFRRNNFRNSNFRNSFRNKHCLLLHPFRRHLQEASAVEPDLGRSVGTGTAMERPLAVLPLS